MSCWSFGASFIHLWVMTLGTSFFLASNDMEKQTIVGRLAGNWHCWMLNADECWWMVSESEEGKERGTGMEMTGSTKKVWGIGLLNSFIVC
jgi:hypothetical protein